MFSFLKAYFDFIVYSFGGWIVQGIYVGFKKRRFVNTGFLYGPYVPIYGFGALIVLYILVPISSNPFFLFFGAMLLTSVLEYFTSWTMQKIFHRLWWNYSNRPFNLHGRICLLNSTLYGIAALFINYVAQPLVNRLYAWMGHPALVFFEAVFSVIFFTDLFFTLRHMLEHKHLLETIHQHAAALAEHKEAVLAGKIPQHLQAAAANMAQAAARLESSGSQRLKAAFEHAVIAEPYASSAEFAKNVKHNNSK